MGLRVSVSSAETPCPCCIINLVFPQGEGTHVGVNVTVIGPALNHVVSPVCVGVNYNCDCSTSPCIECSWGKTHGFIGEYYGPPVSTTKDQMIGKKNHSVPIRCCK